MKKPKDWGQPCPNPDCSHYRLMNRGNISAISTYLTQSGKRRIFRCNICGTTFSETQDTVFFDLRTSEEKIMMALKMILVKVDLAGICFVLGVTEETVLEWLQRASQKAQEINEYLLRELPVTQVQLDEMQQMIADADVDAVVIASPIDLRALIEIDKPAVRVRYDLEELPGSPTLQDVLAPILER